MPRNIIHSDVSMDPESESEVLSVAPEEDPEVEVEVEEEDEAGGEGEEEGEGEEDDGGEEEGDEEPEEEQDEEEPVDDADVDVGQESDLDELSSPSASPPPTQTTPSRSSRLKITLKLPSQKPTRSRRGTHKGRDIESDLESEDDDDEQPRAGDTKRPLTTRQAVLASVVGSTHVSLDETSRKKKQLNEAEIALRREETARKRKHLSEKKLEDEKAETINRLLKKKSGTRNKRNALASAEDRTPATLTGAGTPVEGDAEEGEEADASAPPVAAVPTLYRWVSTTRPTPDAPLGEKMTLSFSIPESLLPVPPLSGPDADGDVEMESQEILHALPPSAPPICNIEGCTAKRKYRLVRDWEYGACGMEHLHLLEKQVQPVTS